MHALIMAGGTGSRLNRGEKPLISICGRPMIAYVIEAFSAAGFEPVVAASPKTPMTMNWCRAQGIVFCKTDGGGFVEDMISAVKTLEEHHPLFVCVSDIPCISTGIIQRIADSYHQSGKDACSAWVPAGRIHAGIGGMSCRQQVNGVEACPAGVNILRGDLIEQPQDELQVLISDPGLALNVNTPADLARAEDFFKTAILTIHSRVLHIP